jgi:hypothetical protein
MPATCQVLVGGQEDLIVEIAYGLAQPAVAAG